MRVFIYSSAQDTNGNGVRIVQGFRRLAPEWDVEMVAMAQSWIRYPEEHGGSRSERRRAAARLAVQADVLHLFNGPQGWMDWGGGDGRGRALPTLLHHHGTSFRNDHANIARGANAVGMVQAASTLDLVRLEPGVSWLPAIYHLDELAAIRKRVYEPGEKVRIVHAPTRRSIKGTDAVLHAIAELKRRRLPIEFDLVEKVPWEQCLERIAAADIVVDQLLLGMGSLAVEAMGMSIPVVAGTVDTGVRSDMVKRWGRLPFVEAGPGSITTALIGLVKNADARAEAAARGNAHAMKYHDDSAVVPMLQDIYTTAPRTRRPVSTWRGVKPWRRTAATP